MAIVEDNVRSTEITNSFINSVNNNRMFSYRDRRISRHVSVNLKPSSGVVAHRILKVSNHINSQTYSQHSNHALSTDVIFTALQTNQGAHIRYYAYEWKQYRSI
jgi:uncharacterized membrane protein